MENYMTQFLMNERETKIVITFVAMLVLAAGPLYAIAQPLPPSQEQTAPPPTPAQEQPEVLTRGPVHEAFAEPVNLQVQAGLVAPTQPPANIEEIPPAERPPGRQFVWVPGYWSWDADRNNYIWVSACWRAAPPNMYWVPGYWVTGGRRLGVGSRFLGAGRRSGDRVSAGPAGGRRCAAADGPPPSPDNIWVPPCWYWYQGQYVRRPGYWLAAQPDWVWVPSHYVWTPRGYVFVAGHWDYSLERRGVLFAPVYFPRSVYARCGIFLLAQHRHRHRLAAGQPVYLSALQPLLLRRLLR